MGFTSHMRSQLRISILLVTAALSSGCVSTSSYVPTVELGLGREMPNRIIGGCGTTGIFRVHQPLVPEKVFLGYNHVSAIGCSDSGTLDQFEFFVRMPLRLDR